LCLSVCLSAGISPRDGRGSSLNPTQPTMLTPRTQPNPPITHLSKMQTTVLLIQPNTTQPITCGGKCDPTQPMDGPNPCPSLISPKFTYIQRSNIYQFFCACYQWSWLGPPLAELRYVMYFRFYGRRHVCTQWPGIVDEKNAYTQSDSTRGNRFDTAANT